MANIRDVAKLANVSVATVSRHLRTPDKVAKKSASKVEKAINELNYKPNLLARNFSQARSYTVMVLVPDITNPFLAQVIRGIEEVGRGFGYNFILGDISTTKDSLKEYYVLPEAKLVDGVIQLVSTLPNHEARQDVTPTVLLCDCDEDSICPSVSVDDFDVGTQLTDYLISLGHRRIACLCGKEVLKATGKRLIGYQRSLKKAGIPFSKELLVEGDYTIQSGLDAANEIVQMELMPTAVFSMSDTMAIGLIKGLKAANLRIPEDISVVGVDDIEFANYCDPPLTTIRQPAFDLGSKAMRMLIELIDNKGPNSTNSHHIRLPTELIVRKSTAARRVKLSD